MPRQTDVAEIVLTDPPPTGSGRIALQAGTELYLKHLERLGAKAQELGRDVEATRYGRELEDLRAELLGDGVAPRGRLFETPIRLLPLHVKAIGKGLEFWLKNLRAAKGTVKALGKTELVEEFEEEAKRVEGTLLPFFQEQQSLPLTPETPTSKPVPPDRLGRPEGLRHLVEEDVHEKSLKAVADREAADAEADFAEEHKQVTPIHRSRGRKRGAP